MKTADWNPLAQLPVDNRKFIERCMKRGLCRPPATPLYGVQALACPGPSPSRRPTISAKAAAADAIARPICDTLKPIVAGDFEVPLAEIGQPRGLQRIVNARDAWICLSVEFASVGKSSIGRCIDLDPATIFYAQRRCADLISNDDAYAAKYNALHARAQDALIKKGLIKIPTDH
jgi:hypothetical protein